MISYLCLYKPRCSIFTPYRVNLETGVIDNRSSSCHFKDAWTSILLWSIIPITRVDYKIQTKKNTVIHIGNSWRSIDLSFLIINIQLGIYHSLVEVSPADMQVVLILTKFVYRCIDSFKSFRSVQYVLSYIFTVVR